MGRLFCVWKVECCKGCKGETLFSELHMRSGWILHGGQPFLFLGRGVLKYLWTTGYNDTRRMSSKYHYAMRWTVTGKSKRWTVTECTVPKFNSEFPLKNDGWKMLEDPKILSFWGLSWFSGANSSTSTVAKCLYDSRFRPEVTRWCLLPRLKLKGPCSAWNSHSEMDFFWRDMLVWGGKGDESMRYGFCQFSASNGIFSEIMSMICWGCSISSTTSRDLLMAFVRVQGQKLPVWPVRVSIGPDFPTFTCFHCFCWATLAFCSYVDADSSIFFPVSQTMAKFQSVPNAFKLLVDPWNPFSCAATSAAPRCALKCQAFLKNALSWLAESTPSRAAPTLQRQTLLGCGPKFHRPKSRENQQRPFPLGKRT